MASWRGCWRYALGLFAWTSHILKNLLARGKYPYVKIVLDHCRKSLWRALGSVPGFLTKRCCLYNDKYRIESRFGSQKLVIIEGLSHDMIALAS